MCISDRSLLEGVLIDCMLRRGAHAESDGVAAPFEAGVRRRSIAGLARAVDNEQEHARHVAHLTLRLFDELQTLGFHPYGAYERELLEYAALLHDVGVFISHVGHHKHSYYLIRHSELAGFTNEEIEVIAGLAFYHRKALPKKRHAHFAALDAPAQRLVRKLSVFLRLAEGLDRSHLGLVRDIEVSYSRLPERLALTLVSDADPQLEVWYMKNESSVFEEVFGIPLEIRVRRPDAPVSEPPKPAGVGVTVPASGSATFRAVNR